MEYQIAGPDGGEEVELDCLFCDVLTVQTVEQYPSERPKVAERYRGAPRLNINPENGETLCISCNLCALACPENLIVVTSVRNEQTPSQGPDGVHLRPLALHVLWAL